MPSGLDASSVGSSEVVVSSVLCFGGCSLAIIASIDCMLSNQCLVNCIGSLQILCE